MKWINEQTKLDTSKNNKDFKPETSKINKGFKITLHNNHKINAEID